MSVALKLADINEQIEALQDTLEAMEGISPEEEIALVQKMLDEMEGNREEKLLNVARWRKQLTMETEAVIKSEIKRLQDRKKSYDRKIEGISNYLHYGLEQIGGKLKSPLGSLSIANNPPSVQVVNADEIPVKYWVEVAEVKDTFTIDLSANTYRVEQMGAKIFFFTLDKKAIVEDWKAKIEIPGVKVTQGTSVRFR